MSDQLNNIEQEILEAATEKAEGLKARAVRIVKRIDRQAERNADELLKEADKKLAPEREAIRSRALAIVELDMKRLEAKMREGLVTGIIEDANTELRNWHKEADAKATAVALVKEALESLPGNAFIVELDATTSPLLTEADLKTLMPADGAIKIKTSASSDGRICVMTESGHACVDQSASARLKRMRDDLRREIYSSLFVSQEEA